MKKAFLFTFAFVLLMIVAWAIPTPRDTAEGLIVGYSYSNLGWNSGLLTDSNCQAWWKFNNGAILTDTKGNYNLSNGYTAPTNDTSDYKEGDACVDFEEDNKQGVRLYGTTNDFNWATTNAFTVCFWVKAESSPDRGHLFVKAESGKICVKIFWDYDDSIGFYTGYNNGDSWQYNGSHDSTLSLGQWYHVSCTTDSSRNFRVRILDSSLNVVGTDKTGTWPNPITFNEDARTMIGGETYSTASGDNWFDGKIDEMVVFDTALSTTDTDKIAAGTY